MEPDVLREHLATLHEELVNASGIDPRSRQLLGEIVEDIKRLLERSPDPADPADPATAAVPAPAAEPAEADLPTEGELPAEASASGMSAELPSLPERLEEIAVQYEVRHPTLAASTRRLVDLLVKIGL